MLSLLNKISKSVFGSRNDRLVKQLQKTVYSINQLEPQWRLLSDEALSAKTFAFRARLKHQTLDDILIEAFATVREASRRVLNMRHFDVQLIGGMVLHRGKIAEMRTGEGKTLAATLAAYLNALPGHGVHVVTVNDYLTKRDANWMKPLYHFLGLKAGIIKAGLTSPERKKAYEADITYANNNELGFDYLRKNMALSVDEQAQKTLTYAIIDEVDSILIDEARTPLIMSGPSEESSQYYQKIDQVIPHLQKGEDKDFTIDEKRREVYLTERGYSKLEEQFIEKGLLSSNDNPYSTDHLDLMYHMPAALRAHYLFRRDVDYIIRANQVVIVDEHTGRLMPGRRWSDGLHQAVEAKEGVPIQAENQTLASITFQNYFRLYSKLSGMTGTADTEAYEFHQIYKLEVIAIPTNKPMIRKDLPDKIYLTTQEKWEAIVQDVLDCQKRKEPVLIGTASIENSEILSGLLDQKGVAHQVLNAKRHEQEAQIIAEAGRPGKGTIATNMAGRGVDIILGGNLKAELAALPQDSTSEVIKACEEAWKQRYETVLAVGGLYIIGSERHESRRIDNQLRGRAGRQGDPGVSRFYLSLEDNLFRIFAADRLGSLMQRLGMKPGEAIEHPWITRAIENAQRKVEGHHFDMRKQLLEYDDVANEQRKIVYQQRQIFLETQDISALLEPMWLDVFKMLVHQYMDPRLPIKDWNVTSFTQNLEAEFNVNVPIATWIADHKGKLDDLIAQISHAALTQYQSKVKKLSIEKQRELERTCVLQTLDHLWKEHLSIMDRLKQGIHLRGYAQQNPKQEYKREAFVLFSRLLEALKYQVVTLLSQVDIQLSESKPQPGILSLDPGYNMIGRNDSCVCGSGKKFKHCHGELK